MDTLIYYEVQGNRDQTEGKGGMVVKKVFDTEDNAVLWADSPEGRKACGVMGGSPGEVIRVTLIANVVNTTPRFPGELTLDRQKVWGYRKDWLDKWGYGYMDLRDKPDKDPEWPEFVRLKTKFEGRSL